VRLDGRWLGASPAMPSDVIALIESLRRAYPRTHAVSLALADDVQHQQLVDLLASLVGGRTPAFVAVGWLPDATIERTIAGDPAADQALQARLQLASDQVRIGAELPSDLTELDRSRLTGAVESLRPCVPELEAPLPKQGLELELQFVAQELTELRASGRKLGKPSLVRVEACARDRLSGFRLREHEGPLLVRVRVM
jgi:hypothetical protein